MYVRTPLIQCNHWGSPVIQFLVWYFIKLRVDGSRPKHAHVARCYHLHCVYSAQLEKPFLLIVESNFLPHSDFHSLRPIFNDFLANLEIIGDRYLSTFPHRYATPTDVGKYGSRCGKGGLPMWEPTSSTKYTCNECKRNKYIRKVCERV